MRYGVDDDLRHFDFAKRLHHCRAAGGILNKAVRGGVPAGLQSNRMGEVRRVERNERRRLVELRGAPLASEQGLDRQLDDGVASLRFGPGDNNYAPGKAPFAAHFRRFTPTKSPIYPPLWANLQTLIRKAVAKSTPESLESACQSFISSPRKKHPDRGRKNPKFEKKRSTTELPLWNDLSGSNEIAIHARLIAR
ncbi:MAG: hypothetical protein EOP83_01080 [Verrucomicrobiaceae bacterium]|nr:MAG: hypothetical protein EOP83_01080 [Verrucomicrobiaceae bacterium]